MGLGRFDEAEDAFREAIRRRPNYPDAHAELGQLIWMRTQDVAAASEALDEALERATNATDPRKVASARIRRRRGGWL